MKKNSMQGLLCVVVALCVLGIAAVPANATITPGGATVSATSNDSVLSIGGALNSRCTVSEFTGTINAAGNNLSGTLQFGGRCTDSILGLPINVTCNRPPNTITLTSTASTAGVSASGSGSADATFQCSITIPALAPCSLTVRGPQGPFANSWTFNQATQSLVVSVRPLVVTSDRPASIFCPASSNTGSFSGNYSLISVNGRPVSGTNRLTIS